MEKIHNGSTESEFMEPYCPKTEKTGDGEKRMNSKQSNNWYDIAEEMIPYCSDLDMFKELLEARANAVNGPDGNKRPLLRQYIVNCEWLLDEYGQISKLTEIYCNYDVINTTHVLTKGQLSNIPVVVSVSDFRAAIEKHMKPEISYTTTFGGSGWHTPLSFSSRVTCACCKQPITLEDSHSAVVGNFNEVNIKDIFERIGGANGLSSNSLKNIIEEITNKVTRVMLTDNNTAIINNNVEYVLSANVYHGNCFANDLKKRTRAAFHKAIVDSGIEVNGSLAIPNEYGSESYNGPWFIFDTSVGNIKVGWRKRVIEIVYPNTKYIADTKETKGDGYEHVCSYKELTEAIMRYIKVTNKS